ncbi:hypothetical protein [Thalassobacillus sp. CUG 92003]|uniref:hypothetical protein n=1 Tax=Thalassobacillus sp. CUG 92003 TaxID=2736641 RepID=UPI0015E721CB|nr:hypothetical protein [Thalassobacillus sp. CUG 92003]
MTKPKWAQSNKKIFQIIVGVIIIIALGAGVQIYTADSEKPLSYDEELQQITDMSEVPDFDLPPSWTSVDQKEEIDQFFYDRVKGLKRAKQNGMVISPNQAFEVKDEDATFFVHDMWYTPRGVHYIYSVDLAIFDEERSLRNLPPLVANINIKDDGDEIKTQDLYAHNMYSPREGRIVYQGRMYNITTSSPIRKPSEQFSPDSNPMDQFYRQMDKELETTFSLRLEGTSHNLTNEGDTTTESAPLHYTYSPEKDKVHTVDVNQTIEDDDVKIKLKSIDIGTVENKISFELAKGSDSLNAHMDTMIKSDKGEERRVNMLNKDDKQTNVYYANFEPFNEMPRQLEIQLKTVAVISDESLSFELAADDIKEQSEEEMVYENQTSELLTSWHNTDVNLQFLRYEEYGNLDVQLEFRKKGNPEKWLVGTTGTANGPDPSNPLYVEAVNEKKETFQSLNYNGYSEGFNFNFGHEVVKNSENITFKINNLMFRHKVNETVTVSTSN